MEVGGTGGWPTTVRINYSIHLMKRISCTFCKIVGKKIYHIITPGLFSLDTNLTRLCGLYGWMQHLALLYVHTQHTCTHSCMWQIYVEEIPCCVMLVPTSTTVCPILGLLSCLQYPVSIWLYLHTQRTGMLLHEVDRRHSITGRVCCL